MVPLLILGHQKREEPGDKAVTGLPSPPHSGGGGQLQVKSPTWPQALSPLLLPGFPWGGCAAGPRVQPSYVGLGFTYGAKAGGQRSWKQVQPGALRSPTQARVACRSPELPAGNWPSWRIVPACRGSPD